MKIKTKAWGKTIEVDVSNLACPKYTCFSPQKFTHMNKTIDGSSSTWQDKHYSCSHRNFHGCPDNPKTEAEFLDKANQEMLEAHIRRCCY